MEFFIKIILNNFIISVFNIPYKFIHMKPTTIKNIKSFSIYTICGNYISISLTTTYFIIYFNI